MTDSTYNTITAALGIATLLACVGVAVSLIAMIVQWKTPKRRGHIIRLFITLAAIPTFIGIHQAILWLVFLPALGEQQMAAVNAHRAKKFAATTLVNIGDTFPETSLTTTDGEIITLPIPGKVVLINLFATWCGPCQMELLHIEHIWADHKLNDRFRLVVIGREETAETVRTFRQEHGFTFPMAADPEREVYSLLATESIPRTIVVSPEGRIVYSKAGFIETDIAELNAVLKEQLAVHRGFWWVAP